MHVDRQYVAAALQRLAAAGLAERTPAAELGKDRITVRGGHGSALEPGPADSGRSGS